MARNLREQEPGRGSRHAKAAGTPNIAQGTGRAKRAGLYRITPEAGDAFTIYAKGREADMRAALVAKLGGGDD